MRLARSSYPLPPCTHGGRGPEHAQLKTIPISRYDARMTSAIILSIGDELVLGQTIDTNSAWLSQQLATIGIRIAAHQTVPDDQSSIERAIRSAAADCDVLLISGGLGPTEDDLTRQALAGVLGVPLEMDEQAMQHLTAFFRNLKRVMAESNKIQAMRPKGATLIENTCGTAPGLRAAIGRCQVFVVPGVPKEMKAMFSRDILPALREAGGGAAIVSRTLHTFGLGESSIAEMLGDLMQRGRNPSVGTTVAGGVVSLRVNSYFDTVEKATHELEKTSAACCEKLGNLIYGQDEETLPFVVGKLLKESGKKVATAESCTGGLLAKYLTDMPGSSAFFTHGWVTYSNEAKMQLLGVPDDMLRGHGAVSSPVVRAMAKSALTQAKADLAVAISGIAGPDGGSEEKPLGTVCIGTAFYRTHDTASVEAHGRIFRFPGDREFVRDRSAKMALTIIRFHLLGKELPFPR